VSYGASGDLVPIIPISGFLPAVLPGSLSGCVLRCPPPQLVPHSEGGCQCAKGYSGLTLREDGSAYCTGCALGYEAVLSTAFGDGLICSPKICLPPYQGIAGACICTANAFTRTKGRPPYVCELTPCPVGAYMGDAGACKCAPGFVQVSGGLKYRAGTVSGCVRPHCGSGYVPIPEGCKCAPGYDVGPDGIRYDRHGDSGGCTKVAG